MHDELVFSAAMYYHCLIYMHITISLIYIHITISFIYIHITISLIYIYISLSVFSTVKILYICYSVAKRHLRANPKYITYIIHGQCTMYYHF